MAPPIQTLTLDGHYSVFRRIIAPTRVSRLGGGAMQVRRLYQRPIYEFVLHDDMRTQADAEYLYSFMQYHQGDRGFFFAGNEWGLVSTPLLFGIGDGVTTVFSLNNRYIESGTLVTYTNGTQDGSTPSLEPELGTVTYASPPALGALLTATYDCKYLCFFVESGDVLQSEEYFYQKLFRYPGIVLREQIPDITTVVEERDIGIWDFDPFVGLYVYYTGVWTT